MRQLLRLAVLSILVASSLTAGQDDASVRDSSYAAPDGTRVLQQEIVVNATPAEVWEAFTTAEGLKSWAVPAAWVDFRVGGSWETSYDPAATQGDPANIRNRILSYQPTSMISIQAVQAPPGFEHAELLENLLSVFTFEPVSAHHTLVVAAGVGYVQGEGYDALYEFFRRGNRWTLERLRERFESGPVDWEEVLATMPGGDAAR